MTRTLAIDGGTPLRSTPLPGWPAPGEDQIAAVTAVLRSGRINYWTGEQGRSLEAEYAAGLGRAYGIAVANGTVALELALRAFCIGPGDEVVVPARTFVATAASVVAVGATPVVADVDAVSGNLSASALADALSERTRAVIPVHVGGWPADMDELVALASAHDLVVIEDCAQAHGATYRGRPVGALGSHAATFSFCQDKIVPAGEGGLLVLDDRDAYLRAWAYKDQGKSLEAVLSPPEPESGPFRWLVDSFGTNWRIDELSASLARTGLAKLPEWVAARRRNATRLAGALADLPALRVALAPADTQDSHYRLYARVVPEALASGWHRDRIIAAIAAEGVPVQYGTCAEIYRERAFAAAGLGPHGGRLPHAAGFHDTQLAFFVHPTLADADIDDTAHAVRAVLEAASR